MSLPNGFKNSCEYFHQVNEFLKKNSWIYRAANTEFLKAGILNDMPQEIKDCFLKIEIDELNKFPYVHEPLSKLYVKAINDFRQDLVKLIPLEAYSEPKDFIKPVGMDNLKKMNLKKQHEIQRLAVVVRETLQQTANEDENEPEDGDGDKWQQKYVVIDVGSGLGYLSELLYKLNNNLLVLGLEADSYRVAAARKRIKTYMPTVNNSIQYRQQFITENSKKFIVQTVKEVFKLNYQHIPQQTTTKMVIIGLHACADLTITSMELFLQLPQVQHLIIMPCCYHKLQVEQATACSKNLKFKNFPLSASLRQVLLCNTDNHNDNVNHDVINETFTSYLNRPFLRLACQQTLKRWSKCGMLQHQAHGSEMFLRAVAELLKLEEEHQEKKIDLVIVKRKEEKIDLTSLSDAELKSFEIFSRLYAVKRKSTNEFVDWSEQHRNKFNEIIKTYPNGGKLAEGLTCLQISMQKLCENLVLYDRLCFMEERALDMNIKINVRYEKIMDEELSPRCYVLLANKL